MLIRMKVKRFQKFSCRINSKGLEKKKQKRDTIESLNAYYDDRGIALHAFTREIYQLEPSKGTYNLGMSIRVAKLSDHSGLKI